MARFVLPLVFCLGFCLLPGDAAAALLRPDVVVEGDVVKLGDLFDGVGDKADAVVARSPAPGRRLTVDSDWLSHVAMMNGVNWRPRDLFDQAVIVRAGVVIPFNQIEAALRAALVDQGAPATDEIALSDRLPQLIIPVGVAPKVGVRELFFDSQSNRFAATIEIPAGAADATRTPVSGRLFQTVDVPVVAHAIGRGDVIGTQDLNWVKARQDSLRRDIVTNPAQIAGMVSRIGLRAGQMVAAGDLQKPLAVARGALVTMVLNYGSMALTAQGRAQDQGSVGDVIRVINTHSNLTVEGTIDGPNRVRVSLNGGVALAN